MPPKSAQAAAPAPKPIPGVKRVYLVAYNAISAALWSVVLVRTAQTAFTEGFEAVYPTVGEWTKWTQTLAGLEILHSILGIYFHSRPTPPKKQKLTKLIFSRCRPRPPPHNPHASRLALRPRLGRRQHIPDDRLVARLHQHGARVVADRGGALRLLCAGALDRRRARLPALVPLQRLLCPVPRRHLERAVGAVPGVCRGARRGRCRGVGCRRRCHGDVFAGRAEALWAYDEAAAAGAGWDG